MTAHILMDVFRTNEAYELPADLRASICYALGGHHGLFPAPNMISKLTRGDDGKDEWSSVRSSIIDRLGGCAR